MSSSTVVRSLPRQVQLWQGGDGGNIILESPFIFSLPANPLNSITANAFTGSGGNIEITTNAIFGQEFLVISASSQLGLDGEVIINDPDVDPTSGLVIIDANFVDVESLIAQNPCTGGNSSKVKRSEFIILGKGGLSAQPGDYLTLDSIITPWIPLTRENSPQSWNLEQNKLVKISESESKAISTFSCRND